MCEKFDKEYAMKKRIAKKMLKDPKRYKEHQLNAASTRMRKDAKKVERQ